MPTRVDEDQGLMPRREFLKRLSNAAALGLGWMPQRLRAAEAPSQTGRLEVTQFGARGDAQTLDTSALQKAIDACGKNGGGTVHFPPGRYLTGTLFLRSRVTVELDGAATLLGSTRLEDYPPTRYPVRSYTDNYTERSLIYGEHLTQVCLQGRGTIDGQGEAFKGPYKTRPYLVRLVQCQDVSVNNLTLRDSPMWVQHYLACDGVSINGITVISRCNANNDGIDIDACRRVRIANCDIRSGDDAIVLKSTLDRACKHVVVTNCLLSSDCNAFKLGTESNGGFENIVVSNCAIYDTRLAGIALEMVDGGTLDGVSISNISMDRVRCPIFVRLGNRARPFQEGGPRPGIGSLRNIRICGVQATGADDVGCSITGLPNHPVENVTLRDLRLGFAGGGGAAVDGPPIPEKVEAYPEYSMFGKLPGYGFYCRHVRHAVFEQVDLNWGRAERRPSLWCEDVEQLQVLGWSAASAREAEAFLRLENVREALIHGCRAPRDTNIFMRAGGADSSRIYLMDNDLSFAKKPFEAAQDVPSGAVSLGPRGL